MKRINNCVINSKGKINPTINGINCKLLDDFISNEIKTVNGYSFGVISEEINTVINDQTGFLVEEKTEEA